eukprot:TRINITY_DN5235_c0_g1_i1.p1 TRINITY_DN5235_c0_g1~~TRINITY_DN5235_c0_g1_i1.p1  ORF type:complete len:335 (+),score=63.45 TRINITY_DN5235_c0_g1_i1:60-1064(+)
MKTCLLLLLLLSIYEVTGWSDAFAFTYTTKTSDFFEDVQSAGFDNIYVYAGDVEMYCRGGYGSKADTPCTFNGTNPTAFVYYTSKDVVQKFKDAGFGVYINFDGRIGEGVVAFSKLTASEISELAAATAEHVCGDPNVSGMGWDVEPFNNNQVTFFESLTTLLSACNKRWGVFAFPTDFNTRMWSSFKQTGFVLDSSYDLSTPCKCIEPSLYTTLLTNRLTDLKQNASTFNVSYQITLGASGTTTMYEQYVGGNTCGNTGLPVYNKTCPYSMAQWMQAALTAMDAVKLKSDERFSGVTIYDYSIGNNGGWLPAKPNNETLQVIKNAGYWRGGQQ